ncbi:ATP-dependent nuclease [Cysteiniphilum marinum]|uniref:ATP-dependent nuclease n=1 Tax=Cysteiniphilum marinum TaxID=2774191 RepID=UPI00193BBFD6|nr:AAA family ATPase [Cysteiniphilum marinum]
MLLDNAIKDFLSTTYLRPLRDAETELSSGKNSRLSQILNSSKEITNEESINYILQLIAEANKKLLAEGRAINTTAKVIEEKYLHKLIFTEDVNILSAIIDIAGVKDIDNLTELKKRRHLRTVLEGLNLSLTESHHKQGLGYNNLLFIAAELLLLEQEQNEEFPLLLIEEPEAHLHPQLQMRLLEFIKSKSIEGEQRIIQNIITTHSPNISSKVDPQNLIMMNKGLAFPLRKGETKLEDDNYRFLYKFLDATKANLFFARGVILVEGYAESILIPTIAKLIGKKLEDYGVSIINVGNTGWYHFAKIFLTHNQKYNPVKISILRDIDLWPACAEKKDGNKYGFKERLNGNKQYWEDTTNKMSKIETLQKGLNEQNVSIYISDHWTLEYCLAFYGLFDECYEALGKDLIELKKFDGVDKEGKATYIQREVENTKANFAMQLSLLIEEKYKDRIDDFIKKIPPYIKSAIEHVTV